MDENPNTQDTQTQETPKGENNNADNSTEPTPKTEPEVKTYTQEEVNGMMAKQRKKWEQKVSEAEKLAKMNEEDQAAFKAEQRILELERREKAVTRRELEFTAKSALMEKGLSTDLASLLDYSSAESCKDSIDKVSAVFSAALEKQRKEDMKGTKPPKAPPKQDPNTMTYSQLVEYYEQNPTAKN
jgi:hypothetical protein